MGSTLPQHSNKCGDCLDILARGSYLVQAMWMSCKSELLLNPQFPPHLHPLFCPQWKIALLKVFLMLDFDILKLIYEKTRVSINMCQPLCFMRNRPHMLMRLQHSKGLSSTHAGRCGGTASVQLEDGSCNRSLSPCRIVCCWMQMGLHGNGVDGRMAAQSLFHVCVLP